MTKVRISELTALTTPATGDLLEIVDVSDTTQALSGSSKKITIGNFANNLPASTFANLQTFSSGINLGGQDLTAYEYDVAWTPVLSDAASSGNNSPTAATSGTYTKIGNLVYAQFAFANAIDITDMAGSNSVYITGLPYTSDAQASTAFYSSSFVANGITFAGSPVFALLDNATAFRIAENATGAATSYVTVTEVSGGRIYGQIVYLTAS